MLTPSVSATSPLRDRRHRRGSCVGTTQFLLFEFWEGLCELIAIISTYEGGRGRGAERREAGEAVPRAWASRSRSTPFALRLVQAKVDSLGLVEDEVVGLDTQTPATG